MAFMRRLVASSLSRTATHGISKTVGPLLVRPSGTFNIARKLATTTESYPFADATAYIAATTLGKNPYNLERLHACNLKHAPNIHFLVSALYKNGILNESTFDSVMHNSDDLAKIKWLFTKENAELVSQEHFEKLTKHAAAMNIGFIMHCISNISGIKNLEKNHFLDTLIAYQPNTITKIYADIQAIKCPEGKGITREQFEEIMKEAFSNEVKKTIFASVASKSGVFAAKDAIKHLEGNHSEPRSSCSMPFDDPNYVGDDSLQHRF